MEKKDYFSRNTIENKSEKMLEKLRALGLGHEGLGFNLHDSALLVLDVQKYFFYVNSHAFVPSSQAIIPNILKLIDVFHSQNRPIYFSKHGNDYKSAGMMAVWWKSLLVANSENADLIDEIDHRKGKVIQKESYDAFWKTPLNELLMKDGVKQIVICGVMTHLCCETTARSAFVHDYQIFFTIDGTATYSEDLHASSLLTLSHGFAKPVLCRDIVNN